MMKKPILTKSNNSNEVVRDYLLPILYERLLDLCGFRYNTFTHRFVVLSIMLCKEYQIDEVAYYINDERKMFEMWEYLDTLSNSSVSDNFVVEAEFYDQWHHNSRNVTDHLCDNLQPAILLDKLLIQYDQFIDDYFEDGQVFDHFTNNSTLFIEDYK